MPTTNDKKNKIVSAEQRAAQALTHLGRLQAQAEDTARKRSNKIRFLLGSALETMMRKDPALKARVEVFMAGFLTRNVDRRAFDMDEEKNYFEQLGVVDLNENAGLSVLTDPAKNQSAAPDAGHSKAARNSGAASVGAPAGAAAGTQRPSLSASPSTSASS